MKTTLIFIAALFTTTAFAKNNVLDGQYPNGIQSQTNYSRNVGCYKNTKYLTASGGTLIRNTTTPLNATIGADCKWTPSAAAQSVTVTVKAFDASVKGGSCRAQFDYIAAGAGVTAQVLQSTSVVASSALTVPLTGAVGHADITFPCGDNSQTTSVKFTNPTVATPGAIQWTNLRVGVGSNSTSVAQAQVAAVIKYPGSGACFFGSGNTDLVHDLSVISGDCSAVTPVIVQNQIGNCSSTAAGNVKFTCNNMPAGVYKVTYEGGISMNVSNVNGFAGVYDGVTAPIGYQINSANGAVAGISVSSTFVYTTAGSHTWQLTANGAGNSVYVYFRSASEEAKFTVEYFPNQDQTVVLSKNSNYSPTDYVPSSTPGFGTASIRKCTHARRGANLEIDCTFDTGTTTGTIAQLALPAGLVSKSTLVNLGAGNAARAGNGFLNRSVPSAAAQVFPLIEPNSSFLTFGVYSTANNSFQELLANSITNTGETVQVTATVPIQGWDENQDAPQIVGMVQTPASVNAQHFALQFGSGGSFGGANYCAGAVTCVNFDSSAPSGTTVSHDGAGNYTLTVPGGTCSGPLSCHMQGQDGSHVTFCGAYGTNNAGLVTPTSTAVVFSCFSLNPVAAAAVWGTVQCDCKK